MKFVKQGDVEFLTACDNGFKVVFLSRKGGVSPMPYGPLNMSYKVGDDESRVDENYAKVFDAFGIDSNRFIWINQVHGDDVLALHKGAAFPYNRDVFDCDAVVTDDDSLILSVLTADCVPIFLMDPARDVFAAVHAGWRGTAQCVVKKALDVMKEKFSCNTRYVSAYIGPAIGVCCYEVGSEVAEKLDASLKHGKSTFRAIGGQQYVDLKGYNIAQMIECGISPKRIKASDLCTSCDSDRFFSHRRENETGRQLSLIFKSDGVC